MRKLNRFDEDFLISACRQSPLLDPNEVVKKLAGGQPHITRGAMSALVGSQLLSVDLFNSCINMIREREALIGIAYQESNKIPRPMPDWICNADVMAACLLGNTDLAVRMLPEGYRTFARIFLPVLIDGVYGLLYVDQRDPRRKCLRYFDPRIDSSMPFREIQLPDDFDRLKGKLRECVKALCIQLELCTDVDTWADILHTYPQYTEGVQYFEHLDNTNIAHSGVWVLCAVDFITNDSPCIFFREDASHMRKLLGHQLLLGKFPI